MSYESPKPKVSILNNIPLQLIIVIASVVLIATLLASLAWICCTRNRKKQENADLLAGRQSIQKNSFSPNNPGSIYDFQDANSIDGLSLKEKSDYSTGGDTILPMPTVQTRENQRIERPLPQIVNCTPQPQSWQNLQHNHHQDIESGNTGNGNVLPARRPSFIDRLLAHRNVNASNAIKLGSENHYPIMRSERSVTTPAMPPAFAKYSNTNQSLDSSNKVLTAIGGAFRTLSQNHPYHSRKKYVPSPRQYAIESDYEGTIGGRDADLPMATRAMERRSFCADSITSPYIATTTSTPRIMQQHRSVSNPQKYMKSPLGLPYDRTPMINQNITSGGTHTPGIAGVGTNWQQSEVAIQKPISAKTREAQGKLSDWVLESKYAAVPPPESSSRRVSQASFVISERSLPSVSRQNSMIRTISSTARGSPSMRAVQKVAGSSPTALLQHQIISMKLKNALTQRGSLLAEEEQAQDGGENDIINARRPTFVEHTVVPVDNQDSWQDIQFAQSTPILPETPRDDEAQRILQKKMRKRIRKARRAAQKAAKEAALLEANRRGSNENVEESKGVNGNSSQHDWVKQLLMADSPQVEYETSTTTTTTTTRQTRSNSISSVKRKAVPKLEETSRRASSGMIMKKLQLSPPESPLTSASEGEEQDYFKVRKNRSASAPLHRSFLVESRRSSEVSLAKSISAPQVNALITTDQQEPKLIDTLVFESSSSDDQDT